MRRYLLPSVILLALVLVALVQLSAPASSDPGGEENSESYLPVVMMQPTLTPTATVTPEPTATIEPTATSGVPVGTGVFKHQGTQYFDYSGTMAFGFVHFASGDPAWGGPDNFHVWVAFEQGTSARSYDLDSSGYYSIPINGFPALPIRGPGRAWVTKGSGPAEFRVSDYFNFDTSAGSCWRMDFIECAQGDTSAACQFHPGGFVAVETTSDPLAQSVDGGCPP